MAKTTQAPRYVRVANVLMAALVRVGFKINGFGNPTYLLTVRGRKSGQPRTTPIVVIEQDGNRYLMAPFGLVDWVRNLRAAGEATLTRGRRAETVRATELPSDEAAVVLKQGLRNSIPPFLAEHFEVTTESSPEEFERAVASHPVFVLESVA